MKFVLLMEPRRLKKRPEQMEETSLPTGHRQRHHPKPLSICPYSTGSHKVYLLYGLPAMWLTLLHRDMHLLKISSDIHQHALITCTSEVLGCTMLACCVAYLQYGLLPTGIHVSFIQVSSLGVNCSQDADFVTVQDRFFM